MAAAVFCTAVQFAELYNTLVQMPATLTYGQQYIRLSFLYSQSEFVGPYATGQQYPGSPTSRSLIKRNGIHTSGHKHTLVDTRWIMIACKVHVYGVIAHNG